MNQGACLCLGNICFVPILKNASSSIGLAMHKAGAVEGNFVEQPGTLDHRLLTVLLRDPVDRFISTYNFADWLQGTPDHILADPDRDELYTPQRWFLAGHTPDIIEMFPPNDFLGFHVPHLNKGQHPDRFAQHDSPALRERIREAYVQDTLLTRCF